MRTQLLTVNTQDRPHEIERSEEAAIAGEIARHFLDLREASSAYRATMLISKMHALSQVHPEALWLVMSLLTGDLTEITRSYADMGKEHARSKQAEEQSRARALNLINIHFPSLATAIIELRGITSDIQSRRKEPDHETNTG